MSNNTTTKITGGQFSNFKLKVAETTRPMTARVRQSLFAKIEAELVDANVIDLFAGAGTLGFEAMSRGAQSCIFVEKNQTASDTIRTNAEKMRLTGQIAIITDNVLRFLDNHRSPADIIFCDPPYDQWTDFPFYRLGKIMHERSLLVVKADKRHPTPDYATLPLIEEQQYGRNKVIILGKHKPV